MVNNQSHKHNSHHAHQIEKRQVHNQPYKCVAKRERTRKWKRAANAQHHIISQIISFFVCMICLCMCVCIFFVYIRFTCSHFYMFSLLHVLGEDRQNWKVMNNTLVTVARESPAMEIAEGIINADALEAANAAISATGRHACPLKHSIISPCFTGMA